jgi:hypothetical protein
MQKLEIIKDNFDAAVKAASPELQKVLMILAGQQPVKAAVTKDYRDITTFADVCMAAAVDINEYIHKPENDNSLESRIEMQTKRCKLINRVMNGGWLAKMYDAKQQKWRIWVNMVADSSNPAGFGLSFGDCGCDGSGANLGVRPWDYYKDEPTAKHVAKHFLNELELLVQLEFELWVQENQ